MLGEALVILAALILLTGAWLLNDDWIARHFPPDNSPPYRSIEQAAWTVRILMAAVGLALIFPLRRLAGTMVIRALKPAQAANIALIILALLLALGAAEVILRSSGWNAILPPHMESEPLRQHDPILSWTLTPSHSGYRVTGGRRIGYATDAWGYRQPGSRHAPDFSRPAIIFAGESIMGGLGLPWEESIPAQVGALMKMQTIDMSVRGYATDQSYLRLKAELPRFRQPVAVVMLFSPMLFRRNGEDGRPHLDPDLVLRPAVSRSRLMTLLRRAIPYRSEDETGRAIRMTRAVLRATVKLAHARGAVPIILVPQFRPENPAERLIRERVLGNMDLPVVPVPLDPHWRLADDWHPDAHGAHVMAAAIARHLQPAVHQTSSGGGGHGR